MKLFLMRHGDAEFNTTNDSKRQLTDVGRANVREIVLRDKAELASIDTIWVSPYVRAQQTAQIVTELLDQKINCITHSFLKPSGDPHVVFNELQDKDLSLLLVTHQPLIGTMVNLLAGLEPGRHRLGTAALACMELEVVAPSCGELNWLHQPAYQ